MKRHMVLDRSVDLPGQMLVLLINRHRSVYKVNGLVADVDDRSDCHCHTNGV